MSQRFRCSVRAVTSASLSGTGSVNSARWPAPSSTASWYVPAFGRGSNDYHKYVGDPANLPNPCMHPVERPPFYAVALHPADLGTSAGLRTSAAGEVLDCGRAEPVKCSMAKGSRSADCTPAATT